MSFILFIAVTLSTSGVFFWIGKGRLSLMPLFFLLLYSGDYLTQFSFKQIGGSITRQHGALISRICIMIGLIILRHDQSTRYYTSGVLIICNSILLTTSYYNKYTEGMYMFSQGVILARLFLIGMGLYHNIILNNIITIANGASIELLGIWYIITKLETNQEEDYKNALLNKEIRGYITIYLLSFQLFGISAISCVLQVRCSTFLIALRQHFLSYKATIHHEKEEGLTGRALLKGQKILKWYEDKKNNTYSIMNQLLQRGIVPSYKGFQFLQIAQGVQITGLIILSIRQLHHGLHNILIWYRLGVICFTISFFGIDRQDKLFGRYKKFALIVISGALYITVFSESASWNTIIIRSLSRNCSNMLLCLFYDNIIPESKRILTRSDLLFWMMWTNITVVITLLSLLRIPQLNGDTIFALGCIILGGAGFVSYHIRKKYSII